MDNKARFAKYDMDIQRLEDKLDIIVEMLSMHDEKTMAKFDSMICNESISNKIDDLKKKVCNISNGTKVKPRKIQFDDM